MLGVLKILAADYECVLLDVVEQELRQGLHLVPALQQALDSEWLIRTALQSDNELRLYAEYGQRLIGVTGRNQGETAVLAWTQHHTGATAVLDDLAARNVARDFGIAARGSLRFLIEAVNARHISCSLADAVADELIAAGNSRFPFRLGEFTAWAREHNHLS